VAFPVLRAVLADHRLGRRLLAGLAIAVATAFAAASVQLTAAAGTAIVRELAGTPLAADLVVTPAGADVEQRVRGAAGVALVAPAGAAPVGRAGPGGVVEPWTALRGDAGPLGRYPLLSGRLPAGPDEAAVSEQASRRPGVVVGSALDLVAPDGAPRRLVVTGVVAARAEPLDAVVVAPETALALTGAPPVQLDVAVAPGASAAAVGEELRAALGPDAAVRDAAEVRTGELQRVLGGGLDGVLAALAVFGATAATAAVLTTSCVLGVLAARQRRTVGLLRRAGAGRGQVLRALLVDAGLTGVGAGLAGAALSVGLVELVRIGVRAALGEELPAAGVPWAVLATSAGAAALATVLAAVGPALRLSAAAPAASDGGARTVSRLATAVALAAASVGVLQVPAAGPETALPLVAGAGVLAFGAVIAAGPVLFPGAAAVLGLPLTGLVTGRLALRSARRAPRRATTTIAALTLLGMLLTAVLVGLESMTVSATDRVAARYPAPVTVVATGEQGLPADLADRLAADPAADGVSAVTDGGAVRELLVTPATGTGVDALRDAVTAVVGPAPGAAVLVLAGLRAELEAAVGLVRAIALGLVAATALVGVVGVAVSLALAGRERRRESGTLRALGLTPGQLVAAAGLENGLLAAAGALVGTGLGVVFGVLAVFALREAAVVPLDEVLAGAGALLLVAVVAGTAPAVAAARAGPG
jgi:putative ABC transport system permease protein